MYLTRHNKVVARPTFTTLSLGYSNAAAIMTTNPALPAYIELSEEAAPMKFAGIVDDALAVLLETDATVVVALVLTTVGPVRVVLLCVG